MWSASIAQNKDAYCDAVEQRNEQINALCYFDCEKTPDEGVEGPLARIPIAIKDNISVSGLPLTCASPILAEYTAVYDASVIEKLLRAGMHIVGKTNLDEFGMGSSTTHSIHGITRNPWDLSRSVGGSSGGSAAAVAAGLVPVALGSDTGGSVRQPASFCGVYGLKPSYGALSRYGLVAFASSLDCIGILGESIAYLEDVFSVAKGNDARDASSFYPGEATQKADSSSQKIHSPKRIALCSFDEGILSDRVRRVYHKGCDMLRAQGHTLEKIDFPLIDQGIAAYYVMAAAEASSNLARYDGVRYGSREARADEYLEYLLDTRSKAFGNEVIFRTLLGTYVLRSGFYDQYYAKALAVRQAMRHAFQNLFDTYDACFLPVYPVEAFELDDQFDEAALKLSDQFAVLANLSGTPALSIPFGEDESLPVGLQLIAPMYREDTLFSIARNVKSAASVARPQGYESLECLGHN